ncbi:PREDICTED: uncharacterized protein LOC101299078 [Fragaria vesca subsp. vesca]
MLPDRWRRRLDLDAAGSSTSYRFRRLSYINNAGPRLIISYGRSRELLIYLFSASISSPDSSSLSPPIFKVLCLIIVVVAFENHVNLDIEASLNQEIILLTKKYVK